MIISVGSPESSYNITLEAGALARLGEVARSLELGRRVVVASDSNAAPLHGEAALAALDEAGFDAHLVVMQAGERAKSWASLDALTEGFIDAGLDRSSWIVALGGGVVGDTVGLAAGLFMRGVPYVQVPTTVLAMADSSIGGKVAIDHSAGKNLVGLFKQPAAVIIDTSLLNTLPADEIANGMAEIVKAGVIADPDLFRATEAGEGPTEMVLAAAIEVKRLIVEEDPYEHGRRALLNLGHTFGHGFERLSGYRLKHGYGVALGMMAAARLAADLGYCAEELVQRQHRALVAQRLPTHWGEWLPGITPEDVLPAMASDKKKTASGLRYVLAHDLGDVRLHGDVPPAAVLAALTASR